MFRVKIARFLMSTSTFSISQEKPGSFMNGGSLIPVLSAFSAFVGRSGTKWEITIPEVFNESELIEAAAQAYIEIASCNPQTMGKSKACYSTLLRLTGIYAKLGRAA